MFCVREVEIKVFSIRKTRLEYGDLGSAGVYFTKWLSSRAFPVIQQLLIGGVAND